MIGYENKSGSMQHRIASAIGELGYAFTSFKEANDARIAEIERKGSADVIVREKVDRINTRLDQYEEQNASRTLAHNRSRVAEESLASLEAVVGSKAMSMPVAERKRRMNVLARAALACTGDIRRSTPTAAQRLVMDATDDEYKAINATSSASGGALCPSSFLAEILRVVAEKSPVRALAAVRTASGRTIHRPKRTGIPVASRVLEQGARAESAGSAWGSTEIGSPEMYTFVDVSVANLEDSAFDLDLELRTNSADAFAKLEGYEFILGNGAGHEFEGILNSPAIGTVVSGSAATIADAAGGVNGLVNAMAGIKSDYADAGTWLWNRVTSGSIRKLKDSDNQYIWQPAAGANGVNLVLGRPYSLCPDMPNEAAGAKPIAFGDWQRAFMVYDKLGLWMLADPFSQALSGNQRLWFRRRSGGAVTMGEAAITLKCAA